ncbi:MAG: hydantoinase B/oxoprolinase family protein, partial [Bacillota bacterium]
RDGAPNNVVVFRRGGSREEYGKITDLEIGEGDVISFRGGGGGGFGDPLERDPEMVRWDVLNGYVSLEAAERDYAVVLDPGTMRVDPQKTASLRAERKARGTPAPR